MPHRKFQYGIFVGIQQKSNEVLVATEEGVVKARTLKRLPEEKRWCAESVLGIKGTPWAPIDGATAAGHTFHQQSIENRSYNYGG